ncbi:MAG: GntP family permease [Deltaproteobacteria bacterium]|jgi:GntP family gluconate:H+ symporter/Gnt-I system low-affinity gluconate transporter|nr:GntP family permease [Deltaproteobacteria bacterium]
MNQEVFAADPTRLVIAAAVGLAALLFLIIKGKIQPFIAILLSALLIGLTAGMPVQLITKTVLKGMGLTLESIALLVGLGSMFGAVLEISGGAERVALTLVKRFGEKRAPWAMGVTGMVIATPVFFDAGLIILIPLAFSIAKRTGQSTLFYVIPLLAGLAVGHAFIPPTPGPVLVAGILNVDLGLVIALGVLCGTLAMVVAGPVFGKYCGKKFKIPVPGQYADQPEFDESKLPGFGTVLAIILVPLFLILLNTLSGVVEAMAPVRPYFQFIGTPFVALLLAILVAMFLLGARHGYTRAELEKVMTKALEPTGLILLVTAGGGVLRYMLQDSGLGGIIGQAVAATPFPLVVVSFLIAAAVRVAVGSATVAMTMAAGIVAAMPAAAEVSQLYLACMVMAVAGGATVMSHVNDSGFWLVKSLCGIDEKTTLKTWTLMETIVGLTGFGAALIISFFAG